MGGGLQPCPLIPDTGTKHKYIHLRFILGLAKFHAAFTIPAALMMSDGGPLVVAAPWGQFEE